MSRLNSSTRNLKFCTTVGNDSFQTLPYHTKPYQTTMILYQPCKHKDFWDFGCPLKDTQGKFCLGCQGFKSMPWYASWFWSRHLLPALYPGPDIGVLVILSNYICGCFCNLLNTSLGGLFVDGELMYRKGHLDKLLQLLLVKLEGVPREMRLFHIPLNESLEGSGH